jgi:A/G-specific adenine glycosylase
MNPAPPFAERLLIWFDQHGRTGLPWQSPRSAYRVWLSEIMLQQTQVASVIRYFNAFVTRFPDIESLAAADIEEVMRYWAGLGYYARARNLHAAALRLVRDHGGEFPPRTDVLAELPGIGRSTAGAIAAQAFGQRAAILDANVKRVLSRWAGIAGDPSTSAVAARLWQHSEALLPHARLPDYTQALMDLGATVCTARQPRCAQCPVAADCIAQREGRTAELPSKKPKRQRPARQALLIIARNVAHEILIKRRPPTGIWGALWCPPIIDLPNDDWPAALAQQEGIRLFNPQAGIALLHRFTHFDLHLQVMMGSVLQPETVVREYGAERWLPLNATRAGAVALPTPIRKILEQLGD